MGSKFDQFLAEQLQDPAVKDAYDDARDRSQLQRHLIELRKAAGASQAKVGTRMGVGQSTVSEFETELDSDPRVSTLQRYARAVGVRICWGVEEVGSRGAHLGLFVPRTGHVDLDYRSNRVEWLGKGEDAPVWPRDLRTKFAVCA